MRFRHSTFVLLQGFLIIGVFLLVYWLFKDGVFDNWATGLFFNGENQQQFWPYEDVLWVKVCYKAASLMTAFLGVSAIGGFAASCYFTKARRYRSFFVLLFLLMALGPGLVVNTILKDNWGRPRPRETVQFAGEQEYQSPYIMSDLGGKSFPCGHCSVGFAIIGFAYWFGARNKKRFWLLSITAIVVGLIMGLSRIVVGAHYLSDVIISGLVVFAIAWLLVTFLPDYCLRKDHDLPAENGEAIKPLHKKLVLVVTIPLAFLFGFLAMLAFPFSSNDSIELDFSAFIESGVTELTMDVLSLNGDGVKMETPSLEINLSCVYFIKISSKGFGLPWNEVEFDYRWKKLSEPDHVELLLSRKKKGVFAELQSNVAIKKLNP